MVDEAFPGDDFEGIGYNIAVHGQNPAAAVEEQAGMPPAAAGHVQDPPAGGHLDCESLDPGRRRRQAVVGG